MNLATMTMERMTKMLRAVDQKYKEFSTEPYGVRKLTLGEQRQMYENLTEEQLYEMIEEHGINAVNKWLYRMERGGK